MDNRLKILESLLPYLDEYTKESKETTLEDFAAYLLSSSKKDKEPSSFSSLTIFEKYADTNASITFHLSRLGKYAKYYLKDAFKDIELNNGDDFGYLATVIEKKKINKSDLISSNISELSSGMQVIKRLIKNGLLIEEIDFVDRRNKVLSATDKGHEVFIEATKKMPLVALIIGAQLSTNEKSTLVDLLNKLDRFHEEIYSTEKSYDLQLIAEKYMKTIKSLD